LPQHLEDDLSVCHGMQVELVTNIYGNI